MTNGFEVTVLVADDVDEVWAHLTDWQAAPAWMKGIESIAPLGDAPPGEGSILLFRARGAERQATIAAWSPPHRLVLRSQQGGMTATYTYSCMPEAGGTRLSLHARCEARGFLWRLASPLIAALMKRTDSGQVAAIKDIIESKAR